MTDQTSTLPPLEFSDPGDAVDLLDTCRRRAQRLPVRGGVLVAVIAGDDETSLEAIECQAHDLSPRGIGLLVDSPFERETRLLVEFAYVHSGEYRRLRKIGRVVYSSPLAEQWRVGVEFVR